MQVQLGHADIGTTADVYPPVDLETVHQNAADLESVSLEACGRFGPIWGPKKTIQLRGKDSIDLWVMRPIQTLSALSLQPFTSSLIPSGWPFLALHVHQTVHQFVHQLTTESETERSDRPLLEQMVY